MALYRGEEGSVKFKNSAGTTEAVAQTTSWSSVQLTTTTNFGFVGNKWEEAGPLLLGGGYWESSEINWEDFD